MNAVNRLGVAAMASAVAGVVHIAAAIDHDGSGSLVVLFATAAAAQIGWAAVALMRGSRRIALAGVAINGACVAAWAASRTVGLPIVDALREVQTVDVQDLAAAAAGAGAVVAALHGAFVRRVASTRLPAFGMAIIGVASINLLVAGVATEHRHRAADAHTHDGGEEHAAAPIVSITDPRVTAEERAAAERLIAATRAGLAGFADQASVEAAGYETIGDAISGHEHFVNWEYLRDRAVLDPDRIESIVFEVHPDGTKSLASAMYILPPGHTMADVPDIAGGLTTWHDHQDLCWEGRRVVGRVIDGSCQPGGVFVPTPPMLHVWLVEHPCGPFAGLDGHGGGCDHG